MVAEAIEERYPESSYLPLLASEIARMDARTKSDVEYRRNEFSRCRVARYVRP